MNTRSLILLAGFGSAAMLIGAFGFQHLGGLAPCKLCLWQRWPHAAAVLVCALALVFNRMQLAWLGGVAALSTAVVGLYHVGVEQGWWQGPTTCTSSAIGGLTPDELLSQILTAPLVRCDEIAWAFLGISMAGWNMVISALLAVIWIKAALRG